MTPLPASTGHGWPLRFVCPHHNNGNTDGLPEDERLARQELEFHHHGDPAIPPRQCFSDFGVSLLEGLGLSVRNRFGLRPSKMPDGTPTPLRIFGELDRAGLLEGVTNFNLHPHLPHFERLGDSMGTCWPVSRSIQLPRRIRIPLLREGGSISMRCCSRNPIYFPVVC